MKNLIGYLVLCTILFFSFKVNKGWTITESSQCNGSSIFTSGSGIGTVGEAVICAKEDWGVPNQYKITSKESNPYGTIYCGYASVPVENTTCTGQAWGGNGWNTLAPTSDATINIDTALSRMAEAEFQKKLYIPLFGGMYGGDSPEWLNTEFNIPFFSDLFDPNYKDPVFEKSFYDWYSGLSESYKEVVESWRELWEETYAYAYPFWNENYLEHRLNWIKQWRDYLANNPDSKNMHMLQLTGEGGELESYLKYGFLEPGQLDTANELFINAGLFEGKDQTRYLFKDPSIWLVSIGNGGRAYKRISEMALEHGLGLGNHGSSHLNTFRFNQHFKHIRYSPIHKTYLRTGVNSYSSLHTDLEEYFGDINTFGEYRVFRFAAASSIALGFNSLLVSSWSIPYQGKYCLENLDKCDDESELRQANFDWDQIKNEGALEFLHWMNYIVGRPVTDTPEAFCLLAQTGVDFPRGGDSYPEEYSDENGRFSFSKAIQSKYQQEDWGEIEGWEYYLSNPIVTHRGFYCLHDQTIEQGGSKVALPMNKERLGENLFVDLTSRNFGDPTDEEHDYFYEGRTTVSPNDPRAKGDHNYYLYFKLHPKFIERTKNGTPKHDYVIKVFFENHQKGNGSFRLEYDGINGWSEGPLVEFTKDMEGIYTVTFRLDDALFNKGGPDSNDFAIRSVDGVSASFLMVRVIKIN